MHPYVVNSGERVTVVLILAALSVAITYGFHFFLYKAGIQWPWWLEGPSVWTSFGILYYFFDKKLWRCQVLHFIGLVRTPDLNGQWFVSGRSSTYDDDFTGKAHIQQTWTKLSVFLETRYSKSHSLTASVLVQQPEGTTINYEYRNEPKPDAPSPMQPHRGTAMLFLRSDSILEGEYYSGRGRQNYGSLKLEKRKQSSR